MRLGICAPYREMAALETYPFDYLEENVQRFLIPEHSQEEFEEFLQEARQLPVPIEVGNSLLLADMRLAATPTQSVDTKRLERYMKTALQRAEQLGIRIHVAEKRDRAAPGRYGEDFRRLCGRGRRRDVTADLGNVSIAIGSPGKELH